VSTKKWNERYSASKGLLYGTKPVDFLADNQHLLPKGKALDLAMGEGRNALFLAEHGCEVTGIDCSEVAVKRCLDQASERGLTVNGIVADLTDYVLPKGEYDIVVNTYYLQRDLISAIKQAVRVGGVVVFETFSVDYLKFNPDMNPKYLLEPGELLDAFRDFTALVFREGIIADPDKGSQSAVSSLIARKIHRA